MSDWSFDENCLFCCLRREKVKVGGIAVQSPFQIRPSHFNYMAVISQLYRSCWVVSLLPHNTKEPDVNGAGFFFFLNIELHYVLFSPE